jgi:hypothetical protein
MVMGVEMSDSQRLAARMKAFLAAGNASSCAVPLSTMVSPAEAWSGSPDESSTEFCIRYSPPAPSMTLRRGAPL